VGVRDLRENCYVTLPLNNRCVSATQRAIRHRVFQALMSMIRNSNDTPGSTVTGLSMRYPPVERSSTTPVLAG
jgi:hypothetical protein